MVELLCTDATEEVRLLIADLPPRCKEHDLMIGVSTVLWLADTAAAAQQDRNLVCPIDSNTPDALPPHRLHDKPRHGGHFTFAQHYCDGCNKTVVRLDRARKYQIPEMGTPTPGTSQLPCAMRARARCVWFYMQLIKGQ